MVELYFKNSRFIGIAHQISSKQELKLLTEQLRKQYKKATHICYGYFFKDNGIETAGFSDDNEPKNTAGKPIYDLLRIKRLYGYVVFVIRFFGGIKLGAGGLIKAYRKTASATIDLISASTF